MFPNDTKSAIYWTDNAPLDCPILLPAIATPRTILGATIISSAGIGKIKVNGTPYLMNTLTNRFTTIGLPVVITNQAITCEWVKGKEYEFAIAYVDYDLTEKMSYELIENETTQASFFLDKSFSYGDFFLMFFLMIFSLIKIVEIIFNKFTKK